MKRSLIIVLCLCLLLSVSVAFADETEGYKVTYKANNCLASVPEDETVYQEGDEVTVLFDPVEYLDYLVFFGWDINDDGIADFGYNHKNFDMPAEDVELKAICIAVSYQAPHPHGPHPHHPGEDPHPGGPRPGDAPRPDGPRPDGPHRP